MRDVWRVEDAGKGYISSFLHESGQAYGWEE